MPLTHRDAGKWKCDRVWEKKEKCRRGMPGRGTLLLTSRASPGPPIVREQVAHKGHQAGIDQLFFHALGCGVFEGLGDLLEQQLGKQPARPAELLGTTAMRRTLDALRARFDRIVIDAPAAMPLADVGILTPLVDSVLLVVRAAITSKPSIHDAVTAIDNSKLLGIVLNEAA